MAVLLVRKQTYYWKQVIVGKLNQFVDQILFHDDPENINALLKALAVY